jgi:hypothetical protein
VKVRPVPLCFRLALGALAHSVLAQSVVVRADRMLDVTAGRIVPKATVVNERGRIAVVNPSSLPQDAKVIDLGDVTLLPGFIDAHVHLLMDDAASYRLQLVTDNASKSARPFLNASARMPSYFRSKIHSGPVNRSCVSVAAIGSTHSGNELDIFRR